MSGCLSTSQAPGCLSKTVRPPYELFGLDPWQVILVFEFIFFFSLVSFYSISLLLCTVRCFATNFFVLAPSRNSIFGPRVWFIFAFLVHRAWCHRVSLASLHVSEHGVLGSRASYSLLSTAASASAQLDCSFGVQGRFFVIVDMYSCVYKTFLFWFYFILFFFWNKKKFASSFIQDPCLSLRWKQMLRGDGRASINASARASLL